MDITKLAVVDSRIVQEKPAYAVEKGALSITAAPFQAISKSTSQHSFQVNSPSLNTYISREFNWTCQPVLDVKANFGVNAVNAAQKVNEPILGIGVNSSLCAYPLHTMVSTMTATINDAVVSLNVADTLREVVRLVDRPEARSMKTAPSMLDRYASHNDEVNSRNSTLSGYGSAYSDELVPNGAWNIEFLDEQYRPLVGGTAAVPKTYESGGVVVSYVDGVPIKTNNNAAGSHMAEEQPLFIRFKLTEKLILSPFIFNEECGDETGFYGVNNIQLVMNMVANVDRVLRNGDSECVSLTSTLHEFILSTLNVEFLTPNLSVPLPSSNVVSYSEFPRYISPDARTLTPGGQLSVASNTFTLAQIPDAFIIYAKPKSYTSKDGEYYLPIEKVNITFDNFTGLLSAHTPEMLFRMARNNGLPMDYLQWRGQGARGEGNTDSHVGDDYPLTGGFLVLKPSRDIALQAGQSCGLVGNYTFQVNCEVFNRTKAAVDGFNLFVIAVNSGFFESQAGSSRIIKGVLTESDVINAPMAEAPKRSAMERTVGGGFLSKLGNALHKAISLKPVRDLAKAGLRAVGPKGQMAADAAEALGLGMSAGARTGGRKSKKAQMNALY